MDFRGTSPTLSGFKDVGLVVLQEADHCGLSS